MKICVTGASGKAGQATVTRTFPVAVEATYPTCQQADIAASAFGANGEWNLSIIVKSDTAESQPATGSVTITK